MEGAFGPVGSSGAQQLPDLAMSRAVCECIMCWAGEGVDIVVNGGFELSPLVGGQRRL